MGQLTASGEPHEVHSHLARQTVEKLLETGRPADGPKAEIRRAKPAMASCVVRWNQPQASASCRFTSRSLDGFGDIFDGRLGALGYVLFALHGVPWS